MEENYYIVKAYLIYLPIAIGITIFVSKVLFKNARVFMMDIFNGREEIALATNRMFQMGFYLLNIGMALFILKVWELESYRELIEALSVKLGGFILYLGALLLFNMFLFFRGKKAASKRRAAREHVVLTNPV